MQKRENKVRWKIIKSDELENVFSVKNNEILNKDSFWELLYKLVEIFSEIKEKEDKNK